VSLVLRTRALEKRFGPLVALHPLDLELNAGSALAVLGPNGAGKSTLLRLLAGLARPSTGSIELHPESESRTRAGRRRCVGLLGHATFLTPTLTTRENLVLAARLYGLAAPEQCAERALAAEELLPVAERRAGALSRGLAQRAAIARALLHDPKLVLLDEPWTGLDARSAERLSQRLAAERRAGRALVVVTHDLGRAVGLAERALLLVRGRPSWLEPAALRDAAALDAAASAALAGLERAG
jgi:ABC-type multidrug transport system ATPase subunit